jgi:trk system potassium uptake protein
MNYRLIANYLSYFAGALGLAMAPSILWGLYYGEHGAVWAFFLASLTCFLVGGALYLAGRNAPAQLYQREALCFVGVSWLLVAALGALPYWYSGALKLIDAYFESMSGFTTTGATVLTDIEGLARSLHFWRALTHWLGGMGIVVLFIAVLPYLGAGGKQLFRSESTGPNPRGLQPRIRDTASFLYKFYLALTAVQTVALMIAGMSLFDALCHTFSTLATGGFSTRQASIAAFDSVLVEVIIIFFMICAGTSFALYFAMVRGDWRALWRSTEWRVYIAVLALASLAIGFNIMRADAEAGAPYGFFGGLRYASFQAVSIMTTTGFVTADFDAWPYFSRTLLVILMFIGGCAGSTAGGIKVIRIMLLIKLVLYRLEMTFRPKMVRAVRVGSEVIDDNIQRLVFAHFTLFALWFAFGTLFMSLLGLPFETAVTSVIATLNNIGPGLELIGAVKDYSLIPDPGKVFLALCMALGRLELFTLSAFLLPSFWKKA